ncbi:flp/Fap pilin component family protein [Asticcacaulis biprosthecium C19]|uniref:Flp/Fap pilin component family protein n=1 Tax=Asticcacaulis biprosthecium C19 TaxID=715226 RepID=F4QJ51_9CAUL|nr:Flp family type IVb pilin [Asticcacaulis biprosthecium]EGF91882.1 flp/Fap pilin component family protein [Asticcacaulis biprosthecium C19]
MLRRFIADERGATAIEYGLVAGLLFLGVVGAITAYGDAFTTMYEGIRDSTEAVMGG